MKFLYIKLLNILLLENYLQGDNKICEILDKIKHSLFERGKRVHIKCKKVRVNRPF